MPANVIGSAQEVKDYIGVIWDGCPAGDSRCFEYNGKKYLDGKFAVSNIYKTVEKV